MAWPPAYSTAFKGTGVTTIKWGTDGILTGNPGSIDGSYWVTSMRPVDLFETIPIENGTGLISTRIGLIQGREWEITVIDDSTISPPSLNSVITIIDPLSSTQMSGRVLDNSYNAARKQPGERVMRVVFHTNIEGAGTIPPTS